MGIVSGIVVYILLWWWVLFMLLPIKANAPDNPDIGHATSAPKNPYIFYKFFCYYNYIWFAMDFNLLYYKQ